jgi:hypothetical protein
MAENEPKKVMLKFSTNIPPQLETALYEFGFTYWGRKKNKWVIYEKVLGKPTEMKEIAKAPEKDWQTALEDRMNRIVDAYLDPYSHLEGIRQQIKGVQKNLPNDQQLWIDEWVERNLDSEHYPSATYGDPPWEDENYQPKLGFC